ncbi:MAG: HAD hydrolase-like protein, partial [Myxococcota bacterium]
MSSTAAIVYLFDIDGTLLLTGGAGSEVLNRVFERRHNIRGAMDRVTASGKTDPIIIAEIFAYALNRQPTADESAAILDEYSAELGEALRRAPRFRLMPEVVSTLDFLAEQPAVTLGLATGNIRAAARAKVERAGLWQRFAFGGYGDDAADRSVLVLRAIERARAHLDHAISAQRIVVVGDTPRDVRAARACATQVIAVATGHYDRAQLEATGADAVF